MPDQKPLTISVPEAGKTYLDLSRNGSYAAAARGEIPTIRIGRLLRVPIAAMEALLATATVHNHGKHQMPGAGGFQRE